MRSKEIKNCEFASLKEQFVVDYPQYEDNKYYHYLYRSLQNLSKTGQVIIDKSNSPFKYSTNVTYKAKHTSLIGELRAEIGNLNFTMYNIKCELFWYSKYKTKFPDLSKEIKLDIDKLNKQFYSINSHKKVILKIIDHLKS